MKKILVIRGGAIGDFLLTLPALHVVREELHEAEICVMGNRQVLELVDRRFYADSVRPIDYRPMANFFGRRTELSEELCEFFCSFDIIIHYLFDPDGIFYENLVRVGAKRIILGPWKPREGLHAALQLAVPVEELGFSIKDLSIRFYPSESDIGVAQDLLKGFGWGEDVLAVHPGSGGEIKNWPIARWGELLERLIRAGRRLIVIGGEADAERMVWLKKHLKEDKKILYLENKRLPVVGAALKLVGKYLGHDSGISHLAAGAGCRCALLYGPTDPEVWAPVNDGVRILRSPSGRMEDLGLEEVWEAIGGWIF